MFSVTTQTTIPAIALTGPPDKNIRFLLADLPVVEDTAKAAVVLFHNLLRDDGHINQTLQQIAKLHTIKGKPLVVCLLCDYDGRLKLPPNVFLLRTSLQRKLRHPREYVLPYLFESFDGPFEPAPLSDKPTVGFCGLSNAWRQPLLDAFAASPDVQTDFIIRHQFWGGKPFDEALMVEFRNNLRNNAYTIASRGAGNFSMRFYQALSVGRIPVLLDTDMVLPFEEKIDWNRYIICGKTPETCLERIFNEPPDPLEVFEMYKSHLQPSVWLEEQMKIIIQKHNNRSPWYRRLLTRGTDAGPEASTDEGSAGVEGGASATAS